MPADYLFTEDADLKIANGDFVVGESTLQHQDALMLMEKGELRQYPKTGVGAKTFLNDDAIGDLYGEVQRQFEADGMSVKKLIVLPDGNITVEAIYRG